MDLIKLNERLGTDEIALVTTLLSEGHLAELKTRIKEQTERDPEYFPTILDWTLYCEVAQAAHGLSLWLLEQDELIPSDKQSLDLFLRIAVITWRTDAIEQFLILGADPNQEVIPERNILDVCVNRTQHAYSCDKQELISAAEIVKQFGGKFYFQEKYDGVLSCDKQYEVLTPYDAWCGEALSDLSNLNEPERANWCELISHCCVKAKQPSKAWIAKANKILNDIGDISPVESVRKWLSLACEPRKTLIYGDLRHGPYYKQSDSIHETYDVWRLANNNGQILKGFVWLLSEFDAEASVDTIAQVTEAMYKKYKLLGIRDTKLANASFEALLRTSAGRKIARQQLEDAINPPAKKKMKAIFHKCA